MTTIQTPAWVEKLIEQIKPKETVAQKAYRLVKDIPHEQWMIKDFTNGKDKNCFIGHYMRLTSKNPSDYSFTNCGDFGSKLCDIRIESRKFLKHLGWDGDAANINNDTTRFYPQSHPKDRVISLLEDMIEAGL